MNSRCFWEEVAEDRYKKTPPSSLLLTPGDLLPFSWKGVWRVPKLHRQQSSFQPNLWTEQAGPQHWVTPVYINRKKSQPRAQDPPGRALISHTFSPDSYWLGWKPHIKTHQSFHLSLMKASTETAALHMWFQLISHPDSLTLAGWAAFLIFTILFCFPLRICLSWLARVEEHNEAGSTSFLECLK